MNMIKDENTVEQVIFEKPSELEYIECEICRELMDDATQIICCGASHCRKCIEIWLSGNDSCPRCRKKCTISQVRKDAKADRLSASYIRPCPYAEQGCLETGNRENIKKHLPECNFLSPSVLRAKMKELKKSKDKEIAELKKLKDQEIEVLKAQNKLLEEKVSKLEVKDIEKSNPNIKFIKIFDDTANEFIVPFKIGPHEYTFKIKVSNFNVSAFIHRAGTYIPACTASIVLIHPNGTISNDSKQIMKGEWDRHGTHSLEWGVKNWLTEDDFNSFKKNGRIIFGVKLL